MRFSVFNSKINNILVVFDCALFVITWLPIQCLINGISNFINPLGNNNLLKPYLFGPLLMALAIIQLPVVIICFIIWTLTSIVFGRNSASKMSIDDQENVKEQDNYTFITANVLLGPDIIGKIQNLPQVFSRLYRIGEALSNINNSNDKPSKISKWTRDQVVTRYWPEKVDFLCLQEVWDLTSSFYLMWKLRRSFKHFIYDVCQNFSNSRFPIRPSGLFLASRFPIIKQEAVFFDPVTHTFENSYQRILSHGFLMAKVDLGQVGKKRNVGFVCCGHLPAYESNLSARSKDSLTTLQESFNNFRKANLDEDNEAAKFAVIAGDTNLCNTCPCDDRYQDHDFFNSYIDLAKEAPGKDKEWVVGTELKHFTIQDKEISTASGFEKALLDDDKRHKHLLDADLHDIDREGCLQPPSGQAEESLKGKRRVDRIFYDPSEQFANPADYRFISALASNTDHVPVSLTLSQK